MTGIVGALPFTVLSAASSYLDWILMAAGGAKRTIDVKNVPMKDLLVEEEKNQEEKAKLYLELEQLRGEKPEKIPELIRKPYPFETDLSLHAKMSVSELKMQGQFTDDAESAFLVRSEREDPAEETERGPEGEPEKSPEAEERLSAAEKRARQKQATDRGTACHRMLELIHFSDISGYEDVKKEFDRVLSEKRMQPDAVRLVSPGMIAKFFRSGIAGRMKMADRQGKLRKESQFILGIPAREMKAADSNELVLIQGIIDAWFEEKDGLVIVDYKTDRVKEGEEQTLLDHYQVQLQYYARALSQITGKRVKEAVIYSLTIQKEINVPIGQ